MSRRIRITGVPREKPNIGLYVLALIELARQQQEQAKDRQESTAATRKAVPDER
ncbi:hypothetical protein [Pseudofrankia sp. BMG5.37]|uniref:hypothetical protein n=1 Tax=Pseudofrankia sp. BMG5.37 TaxID=3050035 RepID=UPI00289584A4|nr:hypothetical protein [Pseudofrankia sp. BMG5.37]MDT3438279.1 hypothetical protein [Pseudofrankia sp. BMG5.37]